MARIWGKRKNQAHTTTGELIGRVRVDERTKNLTKRLREGEIAVIAHMDLDRLAAEALVECKPLAVLNAEKSTSGRYPNLGPQVLLEAGIVLLDDLGMDLMELREGQKVQIVDNQVMRNGQLIAEGIRQTTESNEEDLKQAQANLGIQFEAFTANTMEYLRREKDLLLDNIETPPLRTQMADRQVLVVVRGYSYKEDLQSLRPYIREYRPILLGVDGGADALLEQGLKPDLIVGDMDSVSDKALECGAEIVVHAYLDGRAPGLNRIEELGVPHVVFSSAGTSEDIAMLLADQAGAQLIVALGTHATLIEFLDKGRAGMASTFLTRLKVGPKLVDAKGVSRLYRARISTAQLGMLAIAGLAAVAAALLSTPAGQATLGLIAANLDMWWSALRDLGT